MRRIVDVTRTVDLFQTGEFRLHSGAISHFRIECDALSDGAVLTLANQIAARFSFRAVEGVPRGGLRLAAALEMYVVPDAARPLLIVDDVYTTGSSLERHRAGRDATGVVLFAREPITQPWIFALFQMNSLRSGEAGAD